MYWAAAALGLAASVSDVRTAALRTYVHGMTAEIARTEVGSEGVPALLALLDDPEFPRRDNVVAFLAFLGGSESVPALVANVERGAFDRRRAAEGRARLLVPDALGQIARRGVASAAAVLDQWSSSAQPDPELARLAREALRDDPVAASSVPGQASEVLGTTGDPSANAHSHAMGFANHVSLLAFAMNTDECDALMVEASMMLGHGADAADDVPCCAAMRRTGSGGSFGAGNDGLAIVDNESELNRVLAVTKGRVKLVQLIRWCGEPGVNILGCANLRDDSFVVVRMDRASDEGLLWMHEYGHNLGLPHVSSDETNFMYPYTGAGGVRANQCAAFHAPPAEAKASITRIGACIDDGDAWASPVDNCPSTSNPDQGDSDGDRLGDACDACVNDALNDDDGDGICTSVDNCPATSNASQANFDTDGFGDACETGALLADADLSGLVDGTDLAWLGRAFGATTADGRYEPGVDFNRDGQIDGADLSLLASRFGETSF